MKQLKYAFALSVVLSAKTSFAQVPQADSSAIVYDTVFVDDSSMSSNVTEPKVTSESIGHCVMLPSDLGLPMPRVFLDPFRRKDD